jgi:alpha-tubulin suppressor-like RCC1 family protein
MKTIFGKKPIELGSYRLKLSAGNASKLLGFSVIATTARYKLISHVYSVAPVRVNGLTGVTAISAGDSYACALVSGGDVECWGSNFSDEPGSEAWRSPPVRIQDVTNAVAISTGSHYACALLGDGTIECWGFNGRGQLGTGTTSLGESSPVRVSGITDATAVSAGLDSTCALEAGGKVECWGWNEYGQLGDGTTAASAVPVAVSGVNGATGVSVSFLGFACALISDGSTDCWGDNFSGQLGNGSNADDNPLPSRVVGITDATAVSAGEDSSCALVAGGAVDCWGSNHLGELGNGSTKLSRTPARVMGITKATAISVNGFACALVSGAAIDCWGAVATDNDSPVPRLIRSRVRGIADATAISVGGSFACALLSDGTVECWGDNFWGELGNGPPQGE